MAASLHETRLIELIAQSPARQIFRAEMDGDAYWVKRASLPKAKFLHRLQQIAAACLRLPMLSVTASDGGAEALKTEVTRLWRFRAASVHVPEVVAEGERFYVATDIGSELQSFLQKMDDTSAQKALIEKAARALAALHAKGLVHGRPYLRDMTWDGETIGFLDLEEDPLRVMSFDAAQARDVWIFLVGCARFAVQDAEILPIAFAAYRASAPAGYEPHLKTLTRLARPLRAFVQKYLWNRVRKNVRFAVMANAFLEDHF